MNNRCDLKLREYLFFQGCRVFDIDVKILDQVWFTSDSVNPIQAHDVGVRLVINDNDVSILSC